MSRKSLALNTGKALFESLRSMRALPQKLWIYPGHGDRQRLGIALDNTLY